MFPRVLFGSLARCVGLSGASVDVVMAEGVWRLVACTMYDVRCTYVMGTACLTVALWSAASAFLAPGIPQLQW